MFLFAYKQYPAVLWMSPNAIWMTVYYCDVKMVSRYSSMMFFSNASTDSVTRILLNFLLRLIFFFRGTRTLAWRVADCHGLPLRQGSSKQNLRLYRWQVSLVGAFTVFLNLFLGKTIPIH